MHITPSVRSLFCWGLFNDLTPVFSLRNHYTHFVKVKKGLDEYAAVQYIVVLFCSILPLLFRALPQAEGVLAAMPGMTVALYIDLFARL